MRMTLKEIKKNISVAIAGINAFHIGDCSETPERKEVWRCCIQYLKKIREDVEKLENQIREIAEEYSILAPVRMELLEILEGEDEVC